MHRKNEGKKQASNRSRMSSSGSHKRPAPQKSDASPKKIAWEAPNNAQSTSTASGGITFQKQSGVNAELEIEILKCIVLRENYIERLRDIAKNGVGDKNDLFFDLTELLRDVTIDTVENIIEWKRNATQGSQFMWNGINYLLRIPSDLDFLAKVPLCRNWLGTSAERNPFLISRNLDHSPAATSSYDATNRLVKKTESELSVDRGSTRDNEKLNKSNSKSKNGRQQPKKLLAYSTPVVNDPSLVEHKPETPKKKPTGSIATPLGNKSPESVDMVRILELERHLLQEEEIYGQYTRNHQGKIVPSIIGKDSDNVHGTYTKPVENPYNRPGGNPSEPAGQEQLPVHRKQWPGGMYTIEKAKVGGELSQMESHSATGRKQLPTRTTRAAKMHGEIQKAMKENTKLESEVERLRREIEAKRAALESLPVVESVTSEEASAEMKDESAQESVLHVKDQRATEMELRRAEMEMTQKQLELENRQQALARKQAVRDDFRRKQEEDQLRFRKATIAKKAKEGEAFAEDVDVDSEHHPLFNQEIEVDEACLNNFRMTPQNAAACHIQRIVRGCLGRLRYRRIHNRDTGAAQMIQNCWRRLVAKRRFEQIRLRHMSAMFIERMYRGYLGRDRVRRIRRDILILKCVMTMQRYFRGIRGRRRSMRKRMLVSTGSQCKLAASEIFEADITDLARVKVDEIEPQVITLIQCCLIVLAIGTNPPRENIFEILNWKSCKRGMRRPQFLPKIRALGDAAREGVLNIPMERVAAVQRHFHDPNLTCRALAQVKVGAALTQRLLQWLQTLCLCQESISEFLENDAEFSDTWRRVLACDDSEGIEFWEPAPDDYDSDKIDPENYVPDRVIRCRFRRPRPIIVVMSNCVPTGAKERIIDSLKTTLPSSFVHVRLSKLNLNVLQDVLRGGQSIILETPIGQSGKERRSFNRKFVVAKSTLVPHPLFVLVKGSERNRGNRMFAGMSWAKENWPRAWLQDDEELLGVQEWETDDLDERTDFRLKRLMEDRRAVEFCLGSPLAHDQLLELAALTEPPESIVACFEALFVLLHANETFSGPGRAATCVSWEMTSGLLQRSRGTLAKLLSDIQLEKIPKQNLLALREYVALEKFPKLRHSFEPQYEDVVKLIAYWIDTILAYIDLVDENGGIPEDISKSSTEIFGSIITVDDGIQSFPMSYIPAEDRGPIRDNGDMWYSSDGWKSAMTKVLVAVMRDMQIHKISKQIPVFASIQANEEEQLSLHALDSHRTPQRVRLILSVHQCPVAETMFIFGYDPHSSQTYETHLLHKDVNKLLGPNSIEIGSALQPPRTQLELLDRLYELLALERGQRTRGDGPPHAFQLVLRRKFRRLLRVSRKIDAHTMIITVSEVAPGEIHIKAYNPNTSEDYSVRVEGSTIHKICRVSSSMRERRDLQSKEGNKMFWYLMDRLQLRTISSDTNASLIVNAGIVPGRKIFEGSVDISGSRHVVSVYVCSTTNSMRIVTYLPTTSARHEFLLSLRARELLVGSTSEASYEENIQMLINRLHMHQQSKISEFGRVIRGSAEVSVDGNVKSVVLDRSLFKSSRTVPSIQRSILGEPQNDMKNYTLIVEICVPRCEILVQGESDDDFYEDEKNDDTKLSNYRRIQTENPVLEIVAFEREGGLRFKIAVTSKQIEALAEATQIPWKFCEEGFNQILQALYVAIPENGEDYQLLLLWQNQILGSGDVKARQDVKSEDTTTNPTPAIVSDDVNSHPSITPLPEVLIDGERAPSSSRETTEIAPHIPRDYRTDDLVYKHGHKLGEEEGVYVILSVYRFPLDLSSKSSQFDGVLLPKSGFIFEGYDPKSHQRDVVRLLTPKELFSALGRDYKLAGDGDDEDIISFLIANRLYCDYKDSNFQLCVRKSRMFGVNKMTPLQPSVAAPPDSLEHIVMLPEGLEHRGTRLLHTLKSVPVDVGPNSKVYETFIVTVFKTGEEAVFPEQGAFNAPTLRFVAYNPTSQISVVLHIGGPEFVEAVGGIRGNLTLEEEVEIVRGLMPKLRIRRNLETQEDTLEIPWRQNVDRQYLGEGVVGRMDGKLFSCVLRSKNNAYVMVNVYHQDESVILLTFYDPTLGSSNSLTLSENDEAEEIFDALERNSNPSLFKEKLVELLSERLVVRNIRERDEILMAVYLDGIGIDALDRYMKYHENANVLEQETSRVEIREYNDPVMLSDPVICGKLLSRRARKVSDMYSIITAHEILDFKDQDIVKSILVRVYVPSIAQQSSAMVSCLEDDLKDLQRYADTLVDNIQLQYQGVDAHLKILQV